MKRAAGGDRGNGSNTKLTDLDVLRDIRDKEHILHLKDENELDLDITNLSHGDAAGVIYQHVVKVLERISGGDNRQILK